jgi:thiosulfate dehydrogenase
MKYFVVFLGIIFAVITAGFYLTPNLVEANDSQVSMKYQKADLKNGALLYDNWIELSKTEPEGNHPLYPATAKKSGKTTWRCKECHGWDYIGKKGRYSKGSHYTGITGVFQVRTENPEKVYDSMINKNSKHNFSEYLSNSEIWDLVKFLREGQAPIEAAIDREGNGKGDIEAGKVLYDSHCASCHGMDGNEIDFKSDKDGIQGVGWLAIDNPQESIHKIRWGHPGSNMPSMITDKSLNEQDAINILTYSQSLDSK